MQSRPVIEFNGVYKAYPFYHRITRRHKELPLRPPWRLEDASGSAQSKCCGMFRFRCSGENPWVSSDTTGRAKAHCCS